MEENNGKRREPATGSRNRFLSVVGTSMRRMAETYTRTSMAAVAVAVIAGSGSASVGVAEAAGEEATNGGICGRTAQVKAAILEAVPSTTCDQVTAVELAGVSGTLDLSRKGIGSLQDGDLSGLSGVTHLELHHNSLRTVPAGLLTGLTSLRHLRLSWNKLTGLPEGFLRGRTKLYELRLHTNELSALRADAFTGLPNLRLLDLEFNNLRTLPTGVFNGLDLVFLGLEGKQAHDADQRNVQRPGQ